MTDRLIVLTCPSCGWTSAPVPSSGRERDAAGDQWRYHWHRWHTPYPIITYADKATK